MKIKAHIFSSALFFFLLLLSLPVSAEDDEAPSTLWTYQLGDSNVDFFWDGYWRFHFSSGLALGAEDSFSDYTTPFKFSQTPDLLLSLWIDDRYFFETSVVEDYGKNTYLLGYQGQEGEYIQSVRLGNSSVTTESYASLPVSSPLYNTPGLSFRGGTESMQNEFMIRFDGTWEESKVYIGSYEANEEYLELFDYRKNRRFVLPDQSVDSGSLLVFIADGDGAYGSSSSLKYRLAEEGDYLFDSANAILTLEEEVEGPVAVYYTVGGSAVGSAGLGASSVIPPASGGSGIPDVTLAAVDFTWSDADLYDTQSRTYAASRQETIAGKACLLIQEPGRFSPFALYASYGYVQSLSSDSWRNSLHVTERYGTSPEDPSGFTWTWDNTEKLLTLSRSGAGARDALARYPLGDILPGLYGNAPLNRTELIPYQLRLVTKTSSSGYRLGTGVVPGSLTVTVNGRPEYNYTLDSDRGTVTFGRYIFPSDRVEFNYRRETLNFEGQEMLIYQGNRFFLNDRNTLETAESFNWVFPDGTDNSTPDGGTVQAGVTWEYRGESLKLKTGLTGTADLGDADGVERILGMEDALSSYPVFEEALSAPKAGSLSETDNNYLPADYAILNSGSGPLVDESPSGAPFDSAALNAGFTLAGGSQWTGADLYLSESGSLDYSTLQELRFYVKVVSASGTVGDLVVKLGDNGEDSDFDGDGIIADYDEALVATHAVDQGDFIGGSWKQVVWTLDSADRQKLSRTRSLRFLFAETDGGNTDVTTPWTDGTYQLLIGGLEFVGQSFALSVSDSTTKVSLSELSDGTLGSAYPDEIDRFHSDGSSQRVTRFSWSGFDSGDSWTAVNWQESRNMTRFGKIRFFVRHDGSVGTYNLDLTDLSGDGVHLTWDSRATETSWQMVTIDLGSETADFDGGADNVSLTVDRNAETLNRITLTGEGFDAASGSVYMDEIYFDESVVTLSGKSTVSLKYSTGDLVTGAKGFQWLGKYYLDVDSSATLSGRTGGLAGEEGSAGFDGRTGLEILYLDLNLLGDGTWEDHRFTFWGGHEMKFPTLESPVVLEESFSLGDDSDSSLSSHAAGITLKPTGEITLAGDHGSVMEQEELTQEWSASLDYNSEGRKASLKSDWASLSSEEARHREGYFTVWGDSWAYFLPDESSVESRSVKENLSLKFPGDSLSPEMTLSRSTFYASGSGGKQTSTLSTTLSLPLSLPGEAGIVVTPEYGRTLSVTDGTDGDGGFVSDYRTWGERMFPLLPLTHFLPLAELADADPVMETLPLSGSYSYTPTCSLEVSRNYGSRLSDLFIPSYGKASFTRLYKGETDSRYYSNTWDFTLQQHALNLFGSFGIRPVFPFYATEEIANTLNLTLAGKNTPVPDWESLSWNGYARFEGEKGNAWEVENDLTWIFADRDITDRLSSSYNWRGDRKPYRKIPFSRYLISRESYVTNREELSYSGSSSPDEYSREMEAIHTTQLNIDDLGTVKSWIKMGYLWEDTGNTFGTEIGVELTLTF